MLSKRSKNISIAVLVVTLVMGILSPLSPAKAVSTLGGYISSDTTITAAGGPYEVTSTIYVQSGATLTVEPGAEISTSQLFNDGTIFIVQSGGTLNVGGSGSSVVFRGSNASLIFNQGQALFTNVAVLHLGNLGYLGGTGSGIRNSEIRSTYCSNVLQNVVFEGNIVKNSTCYFSTSLTGNLFIASEFRSDCALYVVFSSVIHGNEFRGFGSNSQKVCTYQSGSESIDATGNYWGTSDPNLISTMVRDQADYSALYALDTSSPLGAKPLNVPEPWAPVAAPSASTLTNLTTWRTFYDFRIGVNQGSDNGLPIQRCQARRQDVVDGTWFVSDVPCVSVFDYLYGNYYTPWGAHQFQLQYRTANDEGWSAWSPSIGLIYGYAPSWNSVGKVTQTGGAEIKATSVSLSWTYQNRLECSNNLNRPAYCPVDSFVLKYSESMDGPWHEINEVVKASPTKSDYVGVIRGLKSATLYYVSVGARNVAGTTWTNRWIAAYTAGTTEQQVQILQSNGIPLANAAISWRRDSGGFSTNQRIMTNASGVAFFPAVPAGPGELTITDAQLASGLKLEARIPLSFGTKHVVVKMPAEPKASVFNVNVRTVDSTGVARAQVQIQNTREGLPVDLSRCNIKGFTFILPKGASPSTSFTTNEGLAMFYGLVDYEASIPYAVNVEIAAGTLKATQSVPLKSSSQGVWFPYLPYVNAIWSHFSGQNGAEVPVTLYGHNAVFTPSPDASKLPDDQKMSVSVIGPDGASTSCDKSATNPTAYFDDQGHGQLAFCPRAAGYYQLVGNGILAGQSQLLLPQGSVPSIPRAGELLPSRKWSTIAWQAPEFNVDGTKMSYSVAFKASGTSKWKACKVAKLKASCKKFTTGRKYDVAIAAKNKFGWSPDFTFSVTAP